MKIFTVVSFALAVLMLLNLFGCASGPLKSCDAEAYALYSSEYQGLVHQGISPFDADEWATQEVEGQRGCQIKPEDHGNYDISSARQDKEDEASLEAEFNKNARAFKKSGKRLSKKTELTDEDIREFMPADEGESSVE